MALFEHVVLIAWHLAQLGTHTPPTNSNATNSYPRLPSDRQQRRHIAKSHLMLKGEPLAKLYDTLHGKTAVISISLQRGIATLVDDTSQKAI